MNDVKGRKSRRSLFVKETLHTSSMPETYTPRSLSRICIFEFDGVNRSCILVIVSMEAKSGFRKVKTVVWAHHLHVNLQVGHGHSV